MLKSICDEGNIALLQDYSDKYITRDTRIIAKCIFCENSFDKSLNELNKRKNFGCKDCSRKIGFDKVRKTMVEKYGVEYAAQSETFKDKMKATCLKNHGVEYALKS
jgi:DNA-directed RNA polymerase subunit RPC12/RpoP